MVDTTTTGILKPLLCAFFDLLEASLALLLQDCRSFRGHRARAALRAICPDAHLAVSLACRGAGGYEDGLNATASVDCGSGRPANGAPREALPQCAAPVPPKTSRVP